MFVVHHSGRTRLVRRAFLLLAFLPAVLLGGWAAWRHASPYRHARERMLEEVLGIDVSAARVVHPRPGVIRFEDLVARVDGAVVATMPSVELEASADEIRVRAKDVAAAPRAAAVAAAAGCRWLGEPRRFRRNVVVEVEGSWSDTAGNATPDRRFALRGECVAAGNGRAIRLWAHPDGEDSLVVQSLGPTADEPARVEVRADIARPVPLAVAAAAIDRPQLIDRLGTRATVAGQCALTLEEGGARGTIAGVVDGVDLAACTTGLPFRAAGDMRVEIDSATLAGGRLEAADAALRAGAGSLDRTAVEAFVGVVGGRPGPGFGAIRGDRPVPFDGVAARVRVDASGVRLSADRPEGLVTTAGGVLVEPPAHAIPIDRLAWALSPGATRAVPATPLSAWILSVLPLPSATGALPRDAPARR